MRRSPDTAGKGPLLCLSLLLLAIPAWTAGNAQPKLPLIAAGDLPGVAIEKEAAYEGKALYGYIDGGAELYLEYGFRRAVVQDLASGGYHIHLEVFEMISCEAAAGIFSVSSQGCSPGGNPWAFTCTSRFQVQKALGHYFLRAANQSGTPEEKTLTAAVVSLVAAKIKDSLYSPPRLFADTLFRRGQSTYLVACGPLGLENGLDTWRGITEAAEGFCLRVLLQESERCTTRTAFLEFAPGGEVTFAPGRWEESAPSGMCRIALATGPRGFLLCETSGDRDTAEKYRAALQRYRNNSR